VQITGSNRCWNCVTNDYRLIYFSCNKWCVMINVCYPKIGMRDYNAWEWQCDIMIYYYGYLYDSLVIYLTHLIYTTFPLHNNLSIRFETKN